ncbi:SDR family oxidoreductase [Roseateles violae]|uniref:SDR family oxidoreductase n=1 Tax=Roseateles violae TaxID=3058042 RepID=A0ABT8DVC8_9BURK|nr:SDR family oxidoreductase [Pelomonas sp. PFR6]MDN3922162.1 SDR family oxidoreductase [Pelomonas sp. PFR6]
MSLSNQTVLVIGGSSGIGLAVTRGALKLGARVIAAGRDAERLASAAAANPGLETESIDITDEDDVAAVFERIGALDHLVVTAGALIGSSPLPMLDISTMREAIGVKLTGSLVAAKHAARHLRPGGSIGFTSGVLARKPAPNSVVKTAINAALEAATRQLARELAPLRVYAVSPGPVNTPSWRFMDDASRSAMFERLASTLPAGFAASDEDTAAGYLFAMQARALTGAVIDLDSGALVA